MKEPEHLYEYMARVVSVYDGDTIRADIDLGFETEKKNTQIRLFGINTPEVRGKERARGLVVRDFLRELLSSNDGRIMLRTKKDKTGKFGRWLADVFVWSGEAWQNVNQLLIEKGMAEAREY